MRTNGLFSSSKASSPVNSTSSSPVRHRGETLSRSMMEENVLNAEATIAMCEAIGGGSATATPYSGKSLSLFRDYTGEAKKLLRAVEDLKNAMHYFVKDTSGTKLFVQCQHMMELAMRRLKKEFHTTLSVTGHSQIVDSPDSVTSYSSRSNVSDQDEEEDQEPTTRPRPGSSTPALALSLENLKMIAECMISAGYGKECIQLYKLVRKSMVDESLYNLGLIEKSGPSNIQKLEWDVLELRIRNWLSGFRAAMKTVFLGERILCDYVFSSSPEKVTESCFTGIAKERALALLSFPEAVAKYKKLSAEKMFRVLDVYEAISGLWPEIETIFSFESFSAVRSLAVASVVKLGDSVRSMLSEFENAILKDTSKAVPGGGVHPLTRYVMNYLVFLSDYGDSLADIFADWPLPVNTPLPEAYFPTASSPSVHGGDAAGEESPVSLRMAWLVLVLLCKLDAKAELYKDVVLAYLFLANNLNYVVLKVRKSNIGPVLGSEWVVKHERKVEQYASNYERMGWSKVMTSFPEIPSPNMDLNDVEQCFRRFNLAFEEVYKTQSSWVIPDPKLHEQVKLSLMRRIVSVYQEYYDKYRDVFRRDFGLAIVIKFAPDDLGNYLSDLFHGGGSSASTTSSYGSSSRSL